MNTHKWIPSTRKQHGEFVCQYCLITNREAAALGVVFECEEATLQNEIAEAAHNGKGRNVK